MTLESWSVYVAIYALVCLTPGPAVLFITSQSAWRGRGAGIAAALGVETANAGYWMLSAIGLAAAIAASQTLFMILKWAGVFYLAWLGLQAIAGSFRADGAGEQDMRPASNAYRDGLIVGLSNPKAMLFFVALLPQFVDPAKPALAQIFILAVSSMAIDFSINSGYAIAAGAMRKALDRTGIKPWFERLVGGAFLSLAALTAFYRRTA